MIALDLTGQKFGRWTVVRVAHGGATRRWVLRCDCGNVGESTAGGLRFGQTKSCGCAVIDAPWSGEDLTGMAFGRLTAKFRTTPKGAKHTMWHCECACGRHTRSSHDCLVSGRSASCGCNHIKHGHTISGVKTPEYIAWSNMMNRCYDDSRRDFANYGARGIYVCVGWAEPSTFLKGMGYRPSRKHSLDRIDNDGSYTCGKCDDCIARRADELPVGDDGAADEQQKDE